MSERGASVAVASSSAKSYPPTGLYDIISYGTQDLKAWLRSKHVALPKDESATHEDYARLCEENGGDSAALAEFLIWNGGSSPGAVESGPRRSERGASVGVAPDDFAPPAEASSESGGQEDAAAASAPIALPALGASSAAEPIQEPGSSQPPSRHLTPKIHEGFPPPPSNFPPPPTSMPPAQTEGAAPPPAEPTAPQEYKAQAAPLAGGRTDRALSVPDGSTAPMMGWREAAASNGGSASSAGGVAPLREGDGVWLEQEDTDGNDAFEYAAVLGYFPDGSCAMRTAAGVELLAHEPWLLQRAAPAGEARQDDQCDLAYLNDGCMLRNLKMRYEGIDEVMRKPDATDADADAADAPADADADGDAPFASPPGSGGKLPRSPKAPVAGGLGAAAVGTPAKEATAPGAGGAGGPAVEVVEVPSPREIHTWTGRMLLVVNPRRALPIYSLEAMEAQLPSSEIVKPAEAGDSSRRPPHVYSVAELAFRGATSGRSHQAIVVSGESGAGKTESTRHMLHYLVWRCEVVRSGRSRATRQLTWRQQVAEQSDADAKKLQTLQSEGGGGGGPGSGLLGMARASVSYLVAEEPPSGGPGPGPGGGGGGGGSAAVLEGITNSLLQSVVRAGDVLEAFGNARTTLNGNSSRFGKFLKLSLAPDGTMRGAAIETYLLEKARVVRHAHGERCFHAMHGVALECRQRRTGVAAGALSWLRGSSESDALLDSLALRPEQAGGAEAGGGGGLRYLQARPPERDRGGSIADRRSSRLSSADTPATRGDRRSESTSTDRVLSSGRQSIADATEAAAAAAAEVTETCRDVHTRESLGSVGTPRGTTRLGLARDAPLSVALSVSLSHTPTLQALRSPRPCPHARRPSWRPRRTATRCGGSARCTARCASC